MDLPDFDCILTFLIVVNEVKTDLLSLISEVLGLGKGLCDSFDQTFTLCVCRECHLEEILTSLLLNIHDVRHLSRLAVRQKGEDGQDHDQGCVPHVIINLYAF